MSDMSGTPAPQEGKSRSWLVIVIVLVVVCCLAAVCLGGAYYLYTRGDQLFRTSMLLNALAAV